MLGLVTMRPKEKGLLEDIVALFSTVGATKAMTKAGPKQILDYLAGNRASPAWLVNVASTLDLALASPDLGPTMVQKIIAWVESKGYDQSTVISLLRRLTPYVGLTIPDETTDPLQIIGGTIRGIARNVSQANGLNKDPFVRCPHCDEVFVVDDEDG